MDEKGVVQAQSNTLGLGETLALFVRDDRVHQVTCSGGPRNCAAHAHSIQTPLMVRVVEPHCLACHLVD
jgi:hypothetical protein